MIPKMGLFGQQSKENVLCKHNTTFQEQNLIPTVKHGGGSVPSIGGCANTTGPSQLNNHRIHQEFYHE